MMDINIISPPKKKPWSWAHSDRVRFCKLIAIAQFAIKNYVKPEVWLKAADNRLIIQQQKRKAFQTPIALPEISAAVVMPGTEQEHHLAHWKELSQRQIGSMTNVGWLQKSKTKYLLLIKKIGTR